MNEETVLAELRTEIRYSEEAVAWASLLPSDEGESDASRLGGWVADESAFLGEFRGSYERLVVDFAAPAFREYFAKLGLEDPDLVRVRVTDSFPGSWIIEATVAIAMTMGVTYKVLKELSGLPGIVEGLSRLRQELLRPQNRGWHRGRSLQAPGGNRKTGEPAQSAPTSGGCHPHARYPSVAEPAPGTLGQA